MKDLEKLSSELSDGFTSVLTERSDISSTNTSLLQSCSSWRNSFVQAIVESADTGYASLPFVSPFQISMDAVKSIDVKPEGIFDCSVDTFVPSVFSIARQWHKISFAYSPTGVARVAQLDDEVGGLLKESTIGYATLGTLRTIDRSLPNHVCETNKPLIYIPGLSEVEVQCVRCFSSAQEKARQRVETCGDLLYFRKFKKHPYH